ncbi:MAG: AEC family transporter [Pseudomonadota bacterium]
MQVLLSVILPVFLVIGAGYGLRWKGVFSNEDIDTLTRFAQNVAIPCLLFTAITQIDLAQSFAWPLLVSFYAGAFSGFALGLLGARFLFKRDWEDSVAIGFVGLFSNSVLLGLPITERAFGMDALAGNYAIIAVHSPLCLGLGITAMEIAKAAGKSLHQVPLDIAKSMSRNPLIIGIVLGLVVNLSGMPMPQATLDALSLLVRAALPVALFGLGGVLYQYRPEGDMLTIAYVVAISILVHPLISWGLARSFELDQNATRSVMVTAAAPPGINVYLFANLYGRGKRVAASAVLIGTTLSLFTMWGWLALLP